MSGLLLAKNVAAEYEKNPDLEAIVIANYGIITFGEDAQTSYNKMIDCVNRAAAYIDSRIRGKAQVTPQTDLAPKKDIKTQAAAMAQSIRGACAHPGPDGRLCRFRVLKKRQPFVIPGC